MHTICSTFFFFYYLLEVNARPRLFSTAAEPAPLGSPPDVPPPGSAPPPNNLLRATGAGLPSPSLVTKVVEDPRGASKCYRYNGAPRF